MTAHEVGHSGFGAPFDRTYEIILSMGRWLDSLVRTAMDRLLDAIERDREGRQLAQMDGRALKDIGLTQDDIERVAHGRAPDNRR